jgi:hypothetical protein
VGFIIHHLVSFIGIGVNLISSGGVGLAAALVIVAEMGRCDPARRERSAAAAAAAVAAANSEGPFVRSLYHNIFILDERSRRSYSLLFVMMNLSHVVGILFTYRVRGAPCAGADSPSAKSHRIAVIHVARRQLAGA